MDTSNDDLRSELETAFNDVEEHDAEIEVVVEPEVEEGKPRDENGRFAKKEEPAQEEPATEQPEEPKPARMSPRAWRKEVADKYWNSLDPELQAEIERREQDVDKGFQQYKPKAQLADEFTQALEPFMPTIHALGVKPAEAAQRLFSVEHQLRFGDELTKMETVRTILNDYGINPNHFFEHLQNVPPPDPNVMAMQRYVQQLENQYKGMLAMQEQREVESLTSQIQAFAADKEYFDLVADDMAALLQARRAPDLQTAYDMAIYANPTTRELLLNKQAAQTQAEQQRQRATAAAVSVKGSSPASGSANGPKHSLREELEAAFSDI